MDKLLWFSSWDTLNKLEITSFGSYVADFDHKWPQITERLWLKPG